MRYDVRCTSSVSPHDAQVQVSSFTPISPNDGCGRTLVRRIAGCPQAGQGFPSVTGAFASKAARRFSSASMRSGASCTRFHAGQLFSALKISERIANAPS